MRLTRLGSGYLFALGLTLFGAVSSGNNLLYYLSSFQAALLAVAAWAGRRNLRGLRAEAALPERILEGQSFRLGVAVSNPGARSRLQLRAVAGAQSHGLDRLEPGGTRRWDFRMTLDRRGMNRLRGLFIESAFPLGLIRHRLELAGEALAYPRPGEPGPSESVESAGEGRAAPRKGHGDELYGVREYVETDDARRINWKLTAKMGRPLVNEYAQPAARRARVECRGDEADVRRAAAACAALIDEGAEVELVVPEGPTGFGKGWLHLDRMLRALALTGAGTVSIEARPGTPLPAPAFKATRGTLRLFYATIAVVHLSLFLIEELPFAWLAALLLAYPAAFFLDRRERYRPPESVWTPLSLAFLLYGLGPGWRWFGVTVSTTHILIYLLLHRMLTRKTPRALAQTFTVCFLGLFMVSSLSVSPAYPLAFLGYLAAAGSWLLASGDEGSGKPAWGAALGALIAAALPAGALVFALLPRVEPRRFVPAFGAVPLVAPSLPGASTVGFSESVSLGFFGELKKNGARAMRLRLPGGTFGGPLHVRGNVLDHFDGEHWTKSQREFLFLAQGRLQRAEAGRAWLGRRRGRVDLPAYETSSGDAWRAEVVLDPLPSAVAFTVGAPMALEGSASLYFDFTGTLYFPNASAEGRRYWVIFGKDAVDESRIVPDYDRFLRGPYLALPRPDPRLRALAVRMARGAGEPLDKARAVEAYLRGHYRYSLFSRGPLSLEAFLFDAKEGNCEYFATAGAMLLRELGVPTRLVTGFIANDWNETGRYYDVRQGDAHAWLEAYVPGRGWVAVDPTPTGALPAGLIGLGRRLGRAVDALQLLWYRGVIGFDAEGQRDALRRVGGWLRNLAGLALALIGGLALRRRTVGAGASPGRVRAGDPFYLHAMGALARAGLTRESWETGREFSSRVTASRPGLVQMPALTDYHYRFSYGGGVPTPEDRLEIKRLLSELRSAVGS